MNFESLILDRRDGVATITLNRPDAFNALTLGLGRELFHAALEVDEDPSVRCVVVTGAGKAFCAGGDVKDFATTFRGSGCSSRSSRPTCTGPCRASPGATSP